MEALRGNRGGLPWPGPAIAAVLLLTLAAGLVTGPLEIGWGEMLHLAALRLGGGAMAPGRDTTLAVVLFDIRLPRLLAAALVGAALASSGGALQAVFGNPLVSPGVLGVLAGASCGAAAGILLGAEVLLRQGLAFAGGLAATALALLLARGAAGQRGLALVLGGVVSGALFTALLSLMKSVADPTSQLPGIVFWLLGSLAQVKAGTLAACAPALGLAVLGLAGLGPALDVMAMGEEEAAALGLPVARLRLLAIALATLAAALSVALAGVVAWVGLIIPHLARLLLGAGNRRVMPASAGLGAVFLMAADTLCRSLLSSEIPLGVATALVGVPVLAVLLRRGRAAWEG